MELSKNYQMIAKTACGKYIIADLGRKGDITVRWIDSEHPEIHQGRYQKFGSMDELLTAYEYVTEWTKNDEYVNTFSYLSKIIK